MLDKFIIWGLLSQRPHQSYRIEIFYFFQIVRRKKIENISKCFLKKKEAEESEGNFIKLKFSTSDMKGK